MPREQHVFYYDTKDTPWELARMSNDHDEIIITNGKNEKVISKADFIENYHPFISCLTIEELCQHAPK